MSIHEDRAHKATVAMFWVALVAAFIALGSVVVQGYFNAEQLHQNAQNISLTARNVAATEGTLIEMKLQREQAREERKRSILPVLRLQDSYFKYDCTFPDKEWSPVLAKDVAPLKIVNVGAATATEVKARWQIDKMRFVDLSQPLPPIGPEEFDKLPPHERAGFILSSPQHISSQNEACLEGAVDYIVGVCPNKQSGTISGQLALFSQNKEGDFSTTYYPFQILVMCLNVQGTVRLQFGEPITVPGPWVSM